MSVKRKAKSLFQIIPVPHPKFGLVYKLTEGMTEHGRFTSRDAAARKEAELIRIQEELKVIKESEDMEFEVDL